MRKSEYAALLNEFRAFFETRVEVGENKPEEGESSIYNFTEDGETYWSTVHIYSFDDVNCSVDKEREAFGVRTDDDFWGVAYLPWRFRFLRIEDIAPILWPEQKLEYIPTSPSHAYNMYYRTVEAERYYRYYKEKGSVAGFKSAMGKSDDTDRAFALDLYRMSDSSRKTLLDMLPKKDPLRKVLLSAKQKAHKRHIRKYIAYCKRRAGEIWKK